MRKSSSQEVFSWPSSKFLNGRVPAGWTAGRTWKANRQHRQQQSVTIRAKRAASGALSKSSATLLDVLVECLLNGVLGNVPYDLLRHFAIFEDQQCWNSADAVTHRG